MNLGRLSGGRLALFAVSAAASAFVFGMSEASGAAKRVFGAISLRNEGQVARHFDVTIFQQPRTRLRRNRREKLVESASVWIGAGGDFKWNRAIVGKRYRVQVTAQPAGTVIFDDTRDVGASDGGSNEVPIPIDANPGEEDPRDETIRTLEQQLDAAVVACDDRVATISAAYDAQIATLNATHAAALASQKAVFEAQISGLNAQISGLDAHVADLQAEVQRLVTQIASIVPPLSGQRDVSFAAPTVTAGETTAQVAQFVLTASDAQAVSITKLRFDKDQDKNADLENLYVEINGVKFGATRGGVGDTQAGMDFNGLYTVAAGGTVTVRVYCDIETSTTAHSAVALIDLIGWVANGDSNGASIPFPGFVNGQDVTFIK